MEEFNLWLESVGKALLKLFFDYHYNPGMLLTEGDLECQLFRYLMLEEPFREYHRTQDGHSSGYIHSQVTWLPYYRRKFFPDLTVLNPLHLNIGASNNPYLPVHPVPSKGFYHNDSAIGIELKFIRHRSNIRMKAREDYAHIVENLIPAIKRYRNTLENEDPNPAVVSFNEEADSNMAFFSVVVCKEIKFFDKAVASLNQYLQQHPDLSSKVFIFVCHPSNYGCFPNVYGTNEISGKFPFMPVTINWP